MKKIVLVGIPEYGNLGDIAITHAETEFIKDNFGEYELVEILEDDVKTKTEEIEKNISKEDIIFLQGGGNLGDEYVSFEETRRIIVNTFPNNKIVIMPQTIHFSNTETGREELEKSKEAYNNHKYLTIIAREEKSYEIMKKEFYKTNIILAPDIVMYLDKTDVNVKRNGATLFLRDDAEKVLTEEETRQINSIVSKYFNKILNTDTHIGDGIKITKELREQMLEPKLQEARSAELVITDRLHGMIFAAITSTPCIAFGNYNHKIKSSFKWLKDFKFIKYIEDISKLEEAIKELKDLKQVRYRNEFAKKNHSEILKYV